MDWSRLLIAGLKAAAMGALVGTSLPSLVTLVIGIAMLGESEAGGLMVIFLPFLIGLACALAGLVVVGLPITLWLRRKGDESRATYLASGLIGGALVSIAAFWWLFGGAFEGVIFLSVFGAMTGGATGHFWWRFARQDEVEGGTERLAEVFE